MTSEQLAAMTAEQFVGKFRGMQIKIKAKGRPRDPMLVTLARALSGVLDVRV